MIKPSYDSIFSAFTTWNLGEHRRMHGKRESVFSDLEGIRRAASLPYEHPDNSPVIKSLQHVQRLGIRINGLEEAKYEPHYIGTIVCDCLKLMSGMQAKRNVGMANNASEYRKMLLRPDKLSRKVIGSAFDYINEEIYLPLQYAELEEVVTDSLKAINARAIKGEDWGLNESPMADATVAGEIICAKTAIAVVCVAGKELGGVENVPLRQPAKDGDYAEYIRPFRA